MSLNGLRSIEQISSTSSVSFSSSFLMFLCSSLLGMNTNHFTADRALFFSKPSVDLWRFEVVYSFAWGRSASASDFLINRPPSNGSCSISPRNGTTLTLFTVSCPDWFDEDGIKDYSLLVKSNDSSQRALIGFSSVSTFEVYLTPSDDLRLMIRIRDRRDCVTQWTNLSSVTVKVETNRLSTLNPFLQVLSIPNQNRVAQMLSSLSDQLNRINQGNLQKTVSSSTSSPSLIFVSILDFRWRCSSGEYFHFFLRLSISNVELHFSVEYFCVGRI
jgi:hypothetical protein